MQSLQMNAKLKEQVIGGAAGSRLQAGSQAEGTRRVEAHPGGSQAAALR